MAKENNKEEEKFALECEECKKISWVIRTDKDGHIQYLECLDCGHLIPYYNRQKKEQVVKTYVDGTHDIEWNEMVLPINSELFDDWSLSKPYDDKPGLAVTVNIHYIPDDKWEKFLVWRFPLERRKPSNIKTVEGQKIRLKHMWQKHMTRAISYRGRIYMKQSAHKDRALLLHELGHSILFLEHSDVMKPNIMNPMSPMWLVDGENTR